MLTNLHAKLNVPWLDINLSKKLSEYQINLSSIGQLKLALARFTYSLVLPLEDYHEHFCLALAGKNLKDLRLLIDLTDSDAADSI
ncbi:hypothetical protein SHDE107825_10285 [Shewanella denitrificans]|jgi:hypothetical protein